MTSIDVIPGKNYAPTRLGRVLVLGLGKSGQAALRYCCGLLGSRVESIFVMGGVATEASLAFAQAHEGPQVRFAFGLERVEGEFDLCIVSPGIPQVSELYLSAQAASTEMIGEFEFAWRESDASAPWIAITGTNGKTTTTSLITHILREAGMDALSVGNIGDVALDVVTTHPAQVYVAEASSYQLASTSRFAPQVAVILGITPDHISWHGSMEAYAQAKFKVLDNLSQVPGACAVLDATNDVVRQRVKAIKALPDEERGFAYVPLGTMAGIGQSMIERCGAASSAFASDGRLVLDRDGVHHDFCAIEKLNIKGTHNVCNALAAASAVSALGVTDGDIARGLVSFAPLEHRIEPCGSIQGVACCNDSKATNVDASIQALTAFESGRIVMLLGGCDKGTDLTDLVRACVAHARAVVCFGAAGPRFFEAFAQAPEACGLTVVQAGGLQSALDAALELAHPADTVLLSPACSSFDEFSCFEERGSVFKALVAAYAAERGA